MRISTRLTCTYDVLTEIRYTNNKYTRFRGLHVRIINGARGIGRAYKSLTTIVHRMVILLLLLSLLFFVFYYYCRCTKTHVKCPRTAECAARTRWWPESPQCDINVILRDDAFLVSRITSTCVLFPFAINIFITWRQRFAFKSPSKSPIRRRAVFRRDSRPRLRVYRGRFYDAGRASPAAELSCANDGVQHGPGTSVINPKSTARRRHINIIVREFCDVIVVPSRYARARW